VTLQTIDARTLKGWLENGEAVLVDVRETAENAAARIEGASLLPLQRVTGALLPPCTGRKLVIHCEKGGRSAAACKKLLAEDVSLDVYNLEGGIEAWRGAGFSVISSGRRFLPLDRQVQLTLGTILLLASLLGYFVTPSLFVLTGFVGAGLTFAGATGFCCLARVLAIMPWNQRAA
jgi:rhodanese-related sulfurtransferase